MKRICRNQACSWRQCQTCLKVAGCVIISVIILHTIFENNTNVQSSENYVRETLNSMTHNNHLRTKLLMSVRYQNTTGNPLVEKYGVSPKNLAGEYGRGVIMTNNMREQVDKVMKVYGINTIVSDDIPLNRMVPDSRIEGCSDLVYEIDSLPDTSIIIPVYNEWPSVLYRTIYSIINRTPRRLLKDIILVDDNSDLVELKDNLENYVAENFPPGLVKIVRQPERLGLIKARMAGVKEARGEVLVFFDSHMEVNIEWLPPLLTEIARNRTVVAMSTLDYIQADTFQYKYNDNYLTRYVWDWRMVFFETFFRPEQIKPKTTSPRPGPAMVGAAYAIDRLYFLELGGYDEGMTVWGGENLEMSWRVWLCGGQLLHVPCSRIGHIARSQPYTFPGGRQTIENFNYKRATEVWMGNYTRFVYKYRPQLKTLDVGDLSSRKELKNKLKCKDFSWYLTNIWPELNVYDMNAKHWGFVQNQGSDGLCLDNLAYLFQAVEALYLKPCSGDIHSQAFTLTNDNRLRTSLQCVIVPLEKEGAVVKLEDCIIGKVDKWDYNTNDNSLIHHKSGLCLDVNSGLPVVAPCNAQSHTQKWVFHPISF